MITEDQLKIILDFQEERLKKCNEKSKQTYQTRISLIKFLLRANDHTTEQTSIPTTH